MNAAKPTLVLGASDNPSRYSYLAVERLQKNGHPVFAIGRKAVKVHGVLVETEKIPLENIDTVTLYLSSVHQQEYYDYITQLKPRRVIFNPGAENPEFASTLEQSGIKALEACTLVMLSTGQY